MKGGVVILCRYSSSRLPGKILKKIGDQPVLYHIYQRLSTVLTSDQLIVATSSEESDDPIDLFCQGHGITCFRGSLSNVAERFFGAAQEAEWEYAIRINGDNLFIDVETLISMINTFESKNYDFVTNVPGRTFPYGMSIEIVKTSFFKSVLQKITEEKYKEHVTLYLYENESIGKRLYIKNTKYSNLQGAKFAIDEPKDFTFAVDLMKKLGENRYNYTLENLAILLNEEDAK